MNLHNAEFIRSVTSVSDCPKDGLVQIAFAGKSNVGKSSVINKLLLRKNFARVGQAPGKTTHINFFCIDKKLYLPESLSLSSPTNSTSSKRAKSSRTSPASAKRLLFRRASRSSPSLQKRATDANSFSRLFSKPQAS